MEGQTLPTEAPFSFDDAERQAYTRCRTFELDSRTMPDGVGVKPVVASRILGYMLLHVPSAGGRAAIAHDINNCAENDALRRLGNMFKDFIIRCFRGNKGCMPTPTLHPSAPSFDLNIQGIKVLLEAPQKSHTDAKQLALRRDQYRCLLRTHMVHGSAVRAKLVEFHPERGDDVETLECAHIFGRFTTEKPNEKDKKNYASAVLEMFRRYGEVDIQRFVTGDSVHDLRNILRLSHGAHDDFGALRICLEVTDQEDIYTVKAFPEYLSHRYKQPVVLTQRTIIVDEETQETITYPKPDPKLLALHTSCAHVLHMSGAAEYVEKVVREFEEINVLASDGRSADLLCNALLRRFDNLVFAY